MPNVPSYSDLQRQQRMALDNNSSYKAVMQRMGNPQSILYFPPAPVNLLAAVARDEVAVFYNDNSADSASIAEYYCNVRPNFTSVRRTALTIPQAIYPARFNTDYTVQYTESGGDIDFPYYGCRKHDFISDSLAHTTIVSPVTSYLLQYPSTKYIIFVIDVPCAVIPDNIWGTFRVNGAMSLPDNITGKIFNATQGKIIPFYITAALKADCEAYITKLGTASASGLTLIKGRKYLYTEDSYGAGYDGLKYYAYPQTISSLSAKSIYRSGAPLSANGTTGLTGIFADQSIRWPHDTGNITISSVAVWGTWGFNGRRYISPNGPYVTNISGEGEVPGLSSMSYYVDASGSGPLTFRGPEGGWFFNYTMESFNGSPGASYSAFYGLNLSWGNWPTTYTGAKNYNSYKTSTQHAAGYRPLQHSAYTQYFRENSFGGTNYSNTPVVWAGHTAEPGYPGALYSPFMKDWMEGKTAIEAVSANFRIPSRSLLIGDPLVRVDAS